jgi:S1-C subfamily serine protease
MGAPQGLELTLSQGIVSGLRDSDDKGYRVIQTDAAISPGSSGGALFDDNGDLVGITTYKVRGGENLNFAVPVNYVRKMLTATATARFTLADLGPPKPVAPRR